MRLMKQGLVSALALAAMTAYADKNGNPELTPTNVPANPDNFNGSNYTALTRIYTESGTCGGLPTVVIEAVYGGDTCMSTSPGGVKVTCQYQGVPQYGWVLEFYSSDLSCQSTPYINVVGTGTACYQSKAADGRVVSMSVDCGGGTAAEISNPATYQTVMDTSLPTYTPSTTTAPGSSSTTSTVAIRLGTSSASHNVASLLVAGVTAAFAMLM